jgi:predicted O-methyltransferase YrrM
MIRGYIHDSELVHLREEARNLKANSIIVEIGSFLGLSASTFIENSHSSVIVYCIDTWDNSDMGYETEKDTYDEFVANMKNFITLGRTIPIRGDSINIGKNWNIPIDLLFVDGNHSKEYVLADLKNFSPFIKPGGVLLMHDYTYDCGVKPAFEQYQEEYNMFKNVVVLNNSSILKAEK